MLLGRLLPEQVFSPRQVARCEAAHHLVHISISKSTRATKSRSSFAYAPYYIPYESNITMKLYGQTGL
jgi:hypothetical protein